MALFQSTVIQKYLKLQNKSAVQQKWEHYQSHFLNPLIQQNIINSKEEQYQEGFLRDLFVDILGFTLNPAPDFNLTTEYKNVKDNKKADGAIVINNKVIGVIELKGTDTTDLNKIELQAFSYKNNQNECTYVIISNFEKLRFYIDNAVDFQEFNLFDLSLNDFEFLYLLLSYENIRIDVAKKIKNESVSQEDKITKQLYADYAEFKRKLFGNLVKLNPNYQPIELFKKSQKLLDRFLFLFFSEDRHLLPPNSVREVLIQWQKLKDMDAYFPLYERFKKYFHYLNVGHKGKQHDIFAYNGGLFKPDNILDNVQIDDDVLYKHTLKLSEYDFASEVDVNILGHIFENSLNEIEEIKAQLEGQDIDKSKTKRKKDGVYYTPKYITKYIVENTVGKLCEEKKAELQITDEEYTKDKKRSKPVRKKLMDKLNAYRDWLLHLTICDPACGSGAFLNETLNFLIEEHHYLDELEANVSEALIVLRNVEDSILENNLYGVDINEESVEIAKLSLWIRTAKPMRKLNNLNNNIKCGNSLIDDPKVAGDKAFNWQKEFPKVFMLKNKQAYHITTALHDSRTSERMITHKVREKRFNGTMPYPNVVPLTAEEEFLVTKTIGEIVQEDGLNILAYNICKDHIHILLVCDEDECSSIVQRIKSKTAKAVNIMRGVTITREHAPLSSSISKAPLSSSSDSFLEKHGEKQNSLWTQKFGKNSIDSEEQLYATINYIENNRQKHTLPEHSKELQEIIENKIKTTYDKAYATEYKGGFDVVIGNPPYVQTTDKFYSHYETQLCYDLYAYFFERGINILKKKGIFGFITPSLFIKGMRYTSLRNFLLNRTEIIEIDDKGDGVFQDVQMPTAITILKKVIVSNQHWDNFLSGNKLIKKLFIESVAIDKISKIMRGLEIGKDKISFKDIDVQFLTGEDIFRYGVSQFSYISNDIYNNFKKDNFYFSGERIIIRETGNRLTALYLNDNITQQNRSLYSIKIMDKNFSPLFILSILNSLLLQFFYRNKFMADTNVFPKIRIGQVKQLPIKNISLEQQQPFITKADQMLSLNKKLQEISAKFERSLQREFNFDKLSTKLQNWYNLSYNEFLQELKKQKVNLTLSQKADWEDYFAQQQQTANNIKNTIQQTDKEIDQMVYKLYGLTQEEIKIVEEG